MTLILSSLVSVFKSPKNPNPKNLIFRRGKGGGGWRKGGEGVGGKGGEGERVGGRKGNSNRLESGAQTGRDNDRML